MEKILQINLNRSRAAQDLMLQVKERRENSTRGRTQQDPLWKLVGGYTREGLQCAGSQASPAP